MDACFLNMLHNPADHGNFAIGYTVDIDLDSILEESIHQYWPCRTGLHRGSDVTPQVFLLIDNFHRAAAENKGWSDQDWVPNCAGDLHRFLFIGGGAVRRLIETQPIQQRGEVLPVFGHFNALGLRSNDVYSIGLESIREIERCRPAKLDNGSPTFFMLIDIQYVLESQRLEIKFVAGVIIGRNRFRIRINHDGLEAFFFEGKRSVHATVVELNSLTDSIRAAAQDHYLPAVAHGGFVFVSVS